MTLRQRGGPAISSQVGLAKDRCWTRVGVGGWKGPAFSGVSLWRNSVYSHENNTHKISHLHTSSLTGAAGVDKLGVLRPDTQEEGIIWRNSVYSHENNLHKEYHQYNLTLLETELVAVLRTGGARVDKSGVLRPDTQEEGIIWRNSVYSHENNLHKEYHQYTLTLLETELEVVLRTAGGLTFPLLLGLELEDLITGLTFLGLADPEDAASSGTAGSFGILN